MKPTAALTTITVAIAAGAALVALARRLELSAIVLLRVGLVRPEEVAASLRLLVPSAVSKPLLEARLPPHRRGNLAAHQPGALPPPRSFARRRTMACISIPNASRHLPVHPSCQPRVIHA